MHVPRKPPEPTFCTPPVWTVHLYLGLGRLKNLREGKGCPKCETAQAVVAFILAAWALWQAYRG
ncbi:hypothetical protein SAMN04488243_1637 [Thermus arciformis]|uniref:Uncharacterized protein n=1 Tax=Thermus arciformis TaxID=482827 RepID=A0A1G7LDN1_9DEIN|nr:hypothetical protein SAMN04488243_1637 [Thermus arciformis]